MGWSLEPGWGEEAEGDAGAGGADGERFEDFVEGLRTVVNAGEFGVEFGLEGSHFGLDGFNGFVGVGDVLGSFEGAADIACGGGGAGDGGGGDGSASEEGSEDGGADGEGSVHAGLAGLGFARFEALAGALEPGFDGLQATGVFFVDGVQVAVALFAECEVEAEAEGSFIFTGRGDKASGGAAEEGEGMMVGEPGGPFTLPGGEGFWGEGRGRGKGDLGRWGG